MHPLRNSEERDLFERDIRVDIVHYGLTIYQMDIVTAFLNTGLDEEIYMAQPPGLPAKLNSRRKEVVLKLKKSLWVSIIE
jgi:hypothetical protein